MEIKRTGGASARHIKALVYGEAGAGKTTLAGTVEKPLIISAESGLMPLVDADLPYVEIRGMQDLGEVFTLLQGEHDYQTIVIDSLSEIGEVCLSKAKADAKDPRQAYGEMQDAMTQLIRGFRDLDGVDVYMTAKLEKSQDEMGRMLYGPGMPGNKMTQGIPYFFDEVFALRLEVDAEGNVSRALQCQPDGLWQAKDRSGKLERYEPADLGAVFRKVRGSSTHFGGEEL